MIDPDKISAAPQCECVYMCVWWYLSHAAQIALVLVAACRVRLRRLRRRIRRGKGRHGRRKVDRSQHESVRLMSEGQ